MPAYRLQTVLELRERAEELAKAAFALATQALAKAREELKKLEEDLERRKADRKARVKAFLDDLMAKGTTALNSITLMNRFEDRLKNEEIEVQFQIDRQKDVVKAAEGALEQRRLEMAEAAKEKKAIEKHKEKWTAQVKKDRDDREQNSQEEIGNALHFAKQR